MMVLCTVIMSSCSGSDIEGDQPVKPVNPAVESVERNSCTSNVVNTYTSDNAEIKTRSIVVPQGNYEALISAKSVHQFIVDVFYKDDARVERDSVAYTVTNTVKGYGLKKTRYARSVKVFENWKEESMTLEDGRIVRAYTFNGEQGGEVFKLSTIDEQTCSDKSVTIKGATFEDLCKNHWTSRKLVKVEPVYLEQDSADFKWYRIDFIFNDALAYGTDANRKDNRKVEFVMHGEKVWIAKEGTSPIIPDDPEEVIAYTAKKKGFEFVKDSISTENNQKITVSKAWIQFEKLLSTGEVKPSYRPEVMLYCRVDTPAVQTLTVADFNIKNLEAETYSKISYGNREERGENIFVQKYSQKFTTKTNKAQFIFDGQTEEATCVDSLGIEHQFESRTFDFLDNGTTLADLQEADGKERKLLTSHIEALFNQRSGEYVGEAELIKLKDGQKKSGIDVINERPKIDGDKVVIEFDKENRYNDGSKDTVFNLVFDPNYRVTVEDPISVKNRNYARKSNEAVKRFVKREATEIGTFAWQACQYSNTFEYVGFNNALQAFVPEDVTYTDEDGLSDVVKVPAWTLNWVKFTKSDKNEGDAQNQIFTDTIHYQFNLAEVETSIRPKQLLRATLNANEPSDPNAIRYEYGPQEYKKVDAQTIFVYRDKFAIYDDGNKKPIGQVGHNITFYVVSPADQEVIVNSFDINKLAPTFGKKVKGEVTTDGSYTITNYTQEAVTKTSKSNQIFVGHSQEVIYTDEFGQEIDFTVLNWEFSEISGEFIDLSNEGDYQRKLFTSTISGRFVDANNYVGKVIFKKSNIGGGGTTDVSYYLYSDKGLKEVGDSTYTYMTQIPVYSDGTKGTAKEIGVNLGHKATAPAKQVKDVTDFNVTEGNPTTGNKTSNGKTRKNKGFTIKGYSTSYTTRSNKVTYAFGFESEEATFIDELGHEETMLHSDWSFVNKNIKTTQLPDQDGYNRYSSNSTVEASYNNVKETLTGEAELRMKAAKTLKNVEYGNHGIDFKSGHTWNAWQEYTKIYSDGSRVNAKKSVDLTYIVNAQAVKDQIASEASAPYTSLTPGSATTTTRSGGENITVTVTSKGYTEGYTIFNDTYTAVSETAVYSEVEDGVEIKFNFDHAEISNVAHNSDNIKETNQTKVVGGITYDIYEHTGVLGYTVAAKSFTASCNTNVLVEKVIAPNVPESWGRVKGVTGHTLVFDPNVGENGTFRDCWIIDFENGKWMVIDNNWNNKTTFFGWDVCFNNSRIRSAVKFDDGNFFPATCDMDGTGWKYIGEKKNGGDKVVDMSLQRALLAGIKNFTGDNTAEVTPELGGHGSISGQTLRVYTKKGVLITTIVSK